MDNLPDEILLTIFDYLPPRILWSIVSKVCRRWKNVVSHRVITMWDYNKVLKTHKGVVAIFGIRHQTSRQSPRGLAINFNTMNIRELVLCDNFPLGEMFMKCVHSIKTLRHLDVFTLQNLHTGYLPPPEVNSIVLNNNIQPGYLLNLARRKELKALHMYGRSQYYAVNEMSTMIVIQAKHLTHLTLRCPEISDPRWLVFSQCINLLQLQLYACWSVTARGVAHVLQLPKLQVLHITGSRMVRITALMELIPQLSRSIVELNLSASSFSSQHIAPLAAALPDLRQLELWRCDLTAADLLQLASGLTKLEHLDTDVELHSVDLMYLSEHPALKELRCLYEGEAHSHIHVRSALTAPPFPLRACGEGPSAGVFLHAHAYKPIDGITLTI
ncbi:unnamed protein product [Colias eurytheme]|nr:unnamed protein product [Colias eurytheme]